MSEYRSLSTVITCLTGVFLTLVTVAGCYETELPPPPKHSSTVAGIEIPVGLPEIEQPKDNIATTEKITLGKRLFFDKNLSFDRTVSCASCHDPDKHWANGEKYGTGVGGAEGTRNVPSLENVAYYRNLFWDGRARSLEAQVLGPLLNVSEMGMPNEAAVLERLNEDPKYRDLFYSAFEDGISVHNLTRAIAAFERTIFSGSTPYDRYVAGDKTAMSAAAIRGLRIFIRKGKCTSCHVLPTFHDHGFYNLGIGMEADSPDLGRFHVIKQDFSRGKFKTTGLRNIAKTAPYMHDGSIATLEEVVEIYDQGGINNRYLSEELREKLRLSDHQKSDLVTFLVEGLTADQKDGTSNLGEIVSQDGTKDLPKVLIIGDSISQGYLPHVVKTLKDKAVVKHNPGNAQHTGTGLKKLDKWLGDTKWDVIHFNWGLWDLCYRNPKSKVQGNRDKVGGKLTTSLEQYEKNLDKLVSRLKKTKAKLIWASTTTVPKGEAGRKKDDDNKYNEAAVRVMKKHGVAINDLNNVSDLFPPELFIGPGNVHFKTAGSKKLAETVAKSILKSLGK